MQRFLSLFSLGCALLLAISGCAPMRRDFTPAEVADADQDQQRIATLQRQLKALQEQLALLKTEQALAGELPATAARAWQPLFESGGEPQGYGLYTYVLLQSAGDLPTAGEAELLTLLDALPGRPDLPQAEQNLFLLPVTPAPGPVRLQTDYDRSLAGRYLGMVGVEAGGTPGAILVCSTSPLGAENTRLLLVVDLAGCGKSRLERILAAGSGRFRSSPDAEPSAAISLAWRIIDQSAPSPFSLKKVGETLHLGCLDE